jgi:hypothetical protein
MGTYALKRIPQDVLPSQTDDMQDLVPENMVTSVISIEKINGCGGQSSERACAQCSSRPSASVTDRDKSQCVCMNTSSVVTSRFEEMVDCEQDLDRHICDRALIVRANQEVVAADTSSFVHMHGIHIVHSQPDLTIP